MIIVYALGRGYLAVYTDYRRYGGYWATGRTPEEAAARLRAGDYGIRRAQEFAD